MLIFLYLVLFFRPLPSEGHSSKKKRALVDDDAIAQASKQEWSIYFSNARVASIFLSKERLEAFGSGAHRFIPRLDAAPQNSKHGVAPPSARWQQALMPKSLFATSHGPAANRYIAFLMPPSLALRKMDNFRELWRKTHDRRVLPIIVADEFCEPMFERELYSKKEEERWHRPVLRNYWDDTVMSENIKYLALGPRHEFQLVKAEEIKTPLQRKYLLSMMVSLSTSPARLKLEKQLRSLAASPPPPPQQQQQHRQSVALPQSFSDVFIHNALEWQNTLPTELKSGKPVPTDKYRKVLLDSVFSISPSGHNPETFRIFEAAEAGSIPVVDYSDRAGACINPWRPFKESNAPFIWVDDWGSIDQVLRTFTGNASRVLEQQARLTSWYRSFMRHNMEVLENALNEHLAQKLVELQEARYFGPMRGRDSGGGGGGDDDEGDEAPSPPADLVQLVAAVRKGGKKRSAAEVEVQQAALREHEARENARHETYRGNPDAMVQAKHALAAGTSQIRRLGLEGYEQQSAARLGTADARSNAPVVPLVTGCGRAGTHTVAELLNSLGIAATHEGATKDGVAVSWFYAPLHSVEGFESTTLSDPEGNQIKLKFVDKRPMQLLRTGVLFSPVVHITREPRAHIEATTRCICARGTPLDSAKADLWSKASWAYVGRHIDLGNSSGIVRSAKYWLLWNKLVEQSAFRQFRIEDLNPRALVEALGLEANVRVREIPTSLKIRASGTYAKREVLDWQTLHSEVGGAMVMKICHAAEKYGYVGSCAAARAEKST